MVSWREREQGGFRDGAKRSIYRGQMRKLVVKGQEREKREIIFVSNVDNRVIQERKEVFIKDK